MSFLTSQLKHVVIIGDGLRASLAAAYLAARCVPSGCAVRVLSTRAGTVETGPVIARPNIRRLHQLLRITEQELIQSAEGQYLYALSLSNGVALPFSKYGQAYKGVNFAQIWARLNHEGAPKPLAHYNISLRIGKAKRIPSSMEVEVGYQFSRPAYDGLLREHAKRHGARFESELCLDVCVADGDEKMSAIKTAQGAFTPDCIIDVRAPNDSAEDRSIGRRESGWRGNVLDVPLQTGFAGLELFTLQSALQRMSDFMPDKSFNPHERAEMTRLARAEQSHILDMTALLDSSADFEVTRPSLQRKINVFKSHGRIVREDYEVFSASEWRAALMSQGHKPTYYNRLLDGFSLEELKAHADYVETAIDQAMLELDL